jgi:hypothetical protein
MATTLAQSNPTKIATKWALINLFAQIVVTYGIQLLNMDMNSPIKYLGYVIMIACLLMTQKEFRDELGGFMTFGEGFSAGFRFSVFAGLLVAVFIYLYLAILSPDVFEKSLATSQSTMVDKGMSSEQIEKGMSIARKYGPIFGAFGVAVVYAIFGAVISLIGASIFKKEKSPADILDELERKDAETPDTDPTV